MTPTDGDVRMTERSQETVGATARPWGKSKWSGVVGSAITAQPDPARNTVVVAFVRLKEDDAALIVRAVNEYDAHKALEDAARETLKAFAVLNMMEGTPSKERPVVTRLRTALQAIDEARGTP